MQAEKHNGQFARFQNKPTRAENQKRGLHERSDTSQRFITGAGIEAEMSRQKHQINLAHLQVRGIFAIRYTAKFLALGLKTRGCAAVQA